MLGSPRPIWVETGRKGYGETRHSVNAVRRGRRAAISGARMAASRQQVRQTESVACENEEQVVVRGSDALKIIKRGVERGGRTPAWHKSSGRKQQIVECHLAGRRVASVGL